MMGWFMLELKDFPDRKTLEKFKSKYAVMDLPGLESWLEILNVAGRLEEELNEFLQQFDLQQSRFFIMILLARNPDGISLSGLSRGIGVANPTMTGIVARMERAGLVERRDSPHSKRESWIFLSEEGRTLLERVLPAHYRNVAEKMKQLTKEDHRSLKAILDRIRIEGETP